MMEIDMHFEVLQRLCNVLRRDGSNMSLGEQGRCWPCAYIKHHLGKVGCVRQKMLRNERVLKLLGILVKMTSSAKYAPFGILGRRNEA